ncbi:hypothetical protein ACO0K9_24785 [Undibacterium sp. Ji50W]|uniref:hypothetical protein n=1 Tax=Undibacterium sp. Ji50W TaxID=3413041 RepID=UPI003BEFD03F
MFALDTLPAPPESMPIIIAQAKQREIELKKITRIGLCFPAPIVDVFPPPGEQGFYSISPVAEAEYYFYKYENKKITGTVRTTVLQVPKYGTLQKDGEKSYVLHPNKGYLGSDNALIQVDAGEFKLQIMYFFRLIVGSPDGDTSQDWCGNKKGRSWKISSTPINNLEYVKKSV